MFEFTQDPEWAGLDPATKNAILADAFAKDFNPARDFAFMRDPGWNALDPKTKSAVIQDAFQTEILPSLKNTDPKIAQSYYLNAASQMEKALEIEQAPESRGLLGRMASGFARGTAQTIGRVGTALELADLTPREDDTDKGALDVVGGGIKDWADRVQKEYNFLKQDKGELRGDPNILVRGLIGGAQSIPNSMPSWAGAAIGAKLAAPTANPLIIAGAAAVGALVPLAATFFAGTYGEEYTAARQELARTRPESTEEERSAVAHRVALGKAGLEFGTEVPAMAAELLTLGGSRIFTQPIKATLRGMLEQTPKEFIKNWGRAAVIDTAGEMVSGGGSEWVSQREGLQSAGIVEGVKESIIPSLFMNLVFGVGAAGYNKVQTNSMMAKLNSDDPLTRVEAINTMTYRLAENTQDKALAISWRDEALRAIQPTEAYPSGEKFRFDERVIDFAKIKAAEDYTEPSTPQLTPEAYARINEATDLGAALQEFNTIIEQTKPSQEDVIIEDLGAKRKDEGYTLEEFARLTPEEQKVLFDKELSGPAPELFKGQQIDYEGKKGVQQRAILIDQFEDGTWMARSLMDDSEFIVKPEQAKPSPLLEPGREIEYQTSRGMLKATLLEPMGDRAWKAKGANGQPLTALIEKITPLPREGEILPGSRVAPATSEAAAGKSGPAPIVGEQGTGLVQPETPNRAPIIENLFTELDGIGEVDPTASNHGQLITRQKEIAYEVVQNIEAGDKILDQNGDLYGKVESINQKQVVFAPVGHEAGFSIPIEEFVAEFVPKGGARLSVEVLHPVTRQIDEIAHEAATSTKNDKVATPDNLRAGNYAHGHITGDIVGFPGRKISVETPRGEMRSEAKPENAPEGWTPGWTNEMKGGHYGYWVATNKTYSEGTKGPDIDVATGKPDKVDVMIGESPTSQKVFVVDQIDPKTKKFDEPKTLIHYPDIETAKAAYLSSYEPGWQGLGAITEMTKPEFDAWLGDGKRKTEPVAYGKETAAPAAAQPTAPIEWKSRTTAGMQVLTAPLGKDAVVIQELPVKGKKFVVFKKSDTMKKNIGKFTTLDEAKAAGESIIPKAPTPLSQTNGTPGATAEGTGGDIKEATNEKTEVLLKGKEPGSIKQGGTNGQSDIKSGVRGPSVVRQDRERHGREVEVQRSLLSKDRNVPNDLRAACTRDGEGLVFAPDGYDSAEFQEVSALAAENKLEAIPVIDTTGSTDGYIEKSTGTIFINIDRPKGTAPMLQTAKHEISHYRGNKDTQTKIDVNSKAFREYHGILKSPKLYGEKYTIAKALEEYAAELESGRKEFSGIVLAEGLLPGASVESTHRIVARDQRTGEGSFSIRVKNGERVWVIDALSQSSARSLKKWWDANTEYYHSIGPAINGTREAPFALFREPYTSKKEKRNVQRTVSEGPAGAGKKAGEAGATARKASIRGPLTERERQFPFTETPNGHKVTAPAVTYNRGVDSKGNVWVRQSDQESNKGRQLLIQFSTELINKDAAVDESTKYYDALYSGQREGYQRLRDFWEIPQWMGYVSKFLPNADVYVVRDMAEAKSFLKGAGYERIVFSAIDVNKAMIKDLSSGFKGKVDIGGYTVPGTFDDLQNAKWHPTLDSLANDLGVEFSEGVDYRHFDEAKVIPRLTMSQGCLHKCAFCTVPKNLIETSTDVIDQQAEAFGELSAKLAYLNDKTFGQAKNYKHLENVYQAMLKKNPDFKGFIIQTTGTQILKMDDAWLQRSGIKYVELGVETYNNAILKEMHKPHNESILDKAAEKLRKNNIALIPNIIIGFKEETTETYQRTLDYLERNADIISHENIYNLALYEGAELATKLKAASASDLDENVREKSFHKNPAIHKQFAEKVFAKGQLGLEKRQFSIRPPSQKEIEAIKQTAQKNGSYMKAPGGSPSLLSKELWVTVRTKAFKNWFGDWEKGNIWDRDDVSKVVDGNGEPLVVYHGTENGGFSVLNPQERSRHDPATFFTNDRGMAASYAGSSNEIALPVPKTQKDLEDIGWSFEQFDGYVEAYGPEGYLEWGEPTLKLAVASALSSQVNLPAGDERGLYPTFLNIRNPEEMDFEGANWDGTRFEQYNVKDPYDEYVERDGRIIFTQDEAEDIADETGGEVETAGDMDLSTNDVVRDAKRYGSDGAIIRNVSDDGGKSGYYAGEPADVFVIFKPEQAKSATWNIGTFDAKNEDARFSVRDTFYSQLQRTLESKLPATGTAEQYQSLVSTWEKKGEFKADELKWSGLDDFLKEKQGKTTKQEVIDYLAANQVQIKEVMKRNPLTPEERREFSRRLGDPEGDISALVAKRDAEPSPTKFEQWQIPGGTNYKELLLTLPTDAVNLSMNETKYGIEILVNGKPTAYEIIKNSDGTFEPAKDGAPWGEVFKYQAAAFDAIKEAYGESLGRNLKEDKVGYQSPHWDEPNVLAHVRMNDREGLNYTPEQIIDIGQRIIKALGPGYNGKLAEERALGSGAPDAAVRRGTITPQEGAWYAHAKGWPDSIDYEGDAIEKTLLLEELQSDWHQEGRKSGYRIEKPLPAGFKVKENSAGEWSVTNPDIPNVFWSLKTEEEATDKARELNRGLTVPESGLVPPAPFSKSWHELVLKRMLRYAVENGYGRMAWTTGEQQFDRYGSEEIAWEKKGDGWQVYVSEQTGGGAGAGIDLENEARIRGLLKEKRMRVNDKGQLHRLTAEVFRSHTDAEVKKIVDRTWDRMQTQDIGTSLPRKEGMEAFYDKIIPEFLNKYGKKWGAKVGTTQILAEKTNQAQRDLSAKYPLKPELYTTVHSIPITESMKKSVMEGQPMFSIREDIEKAKKGELVVYRGDDAPDVGSNQWFTTDIDDAAGYGKVKKTKIIARNPFFVNDEDIEFGDSLGGWLAKHGDDAKYQEYDAFTDGSNWYVATPQFSIRKQDAAYLKAVESNDMETAQKMVDEAAVENGYIIGAAHGTDVGKNFTSFRRRPGDIGIHFGTEGQAQDRLDYIRSRENRIPGPSPRVVKVYLDLRNPLRLEDAGIWDKDNLGYQLVAHFRKDEQIIRGLKTTKDLREYIQRKGYDGVVYKNTGEVGGAHVLQVKADEAFKKLKERVDAMGSKLHDYHSLAAQDTKEYAAWSRAERKTREFREANAEDSYIAFERNQIKSADPVTYDSKGNIIPLPERFNEDNPDIRFAIRKTDKRSLGARILAGMEKPRPRVGPLIARIAQHLSSESAKEGVIDHRTAGPKENRQVETAVTDMLEASVMKHPESLGWYRKDIERTTKILGQLHPDLKKPSNNFWMRIAIAITSDGNKTIKNMELADLAYKGWKATGSLVSPVAAKRGGAIEENLRWAEEVRKGFKSDKEFETWLLGKAPVGEIAGDLVARLGMGWEDAKKAVSGEKLTSIVPGAIIFGPKIGAFFANLSGDFSPVTMDMWFMRTMGRIQGSLMTGDSPEESAVERDRVRAAMESSPRGVRIAGLQPSLFGKYTDEDIDQLSKDIARLSLKKEFRDKLSAVKGGDELRNAANFRESRLEGGATIDAPRSGEQRQWLRERIDGVRKMAKKRGFDYENADIQAAIWIGEKEIYHAYGARATQGDYFSDGANALYEKLHGRPSEFYAGSPGSVGKGLRAGPETVSLFSIRQVDTPPFKKWFGDSKVVDENGDPLVVYHGTTASPFGKFDTEFRDLGSHFGTREQANQFARTDLENEDVEYSRIYPVYLSIMNPIRLEDRGGFEESRVAQQLLDSGVLEGNDLPALADMGEHVASKYMKDKILAAGYDGVVYLNRREGIHDPFGPDGVSGDELDAMSDDEVREIFPDAEESWIALKPEQIKSAIGNQGTFDAANPDIRFAARAADFAKVIQDNPDGFTIDTKTGNLETSGWVVAPSKLTETYVDEVTRDTVDRFLRRFAAVYDNDPRAFLGGWFNKDTGKFALDVAYKVADKETATYLAELGDQDAIFHLDEIGTDTNPEYKTPDAIRELRESGAYSESKRDSLRGAKDNLERIIAGGNVPELGQREGALDGVGLHYSRQPLTHLDTSFAGTGFRGNEYRRIIAGTPNAKRAYIYIHEGNGIRREMGIYGTPYKVPFSNFYEADYDPLKIIPTVKTLNEFERKVMDLGFDGIALRDQGMAVFLGDHRTPVEPASEKDIPPVREYKKASFSVRQLSWKEFSDHLAALPLRDAHGALTEKEKRHMAAAGETWILKSINPATMGVLGDPTGTKYPIIIGPDGDILDGRRRLESSKGHPIDAWLADFNGSQFSIRPPETPEFKKWFGDSRVVDETGKPLVVYHGTNKAFEAFDPKRSGKNYATGGRKGFFFSRSPRQAGLYSDGGKVSKTGVSVGAQTVPVYISLKNPLVVQVPPEFGPSPDVFFDVNQEEIYANAKEAQSDGIIVGEGRTAKMTGGSNTLYIAFSPTQIKSATGNTGAFDANNPDIRFAVRPPVVFADSTTPVIKKDYDDNRAEADLSRRMLMPALKTARDEFGPEISRLMAPISTRLKYINEGLAAKLRRLDMNTNQLIKEYRHAVLPLFEKAKKSMTREDYLDWDYARKNSDVPVLNRLVTQYNLQTEYTAARKVFDDLRDAAIDVGLNIGEIEEYWTRKVKDLKGLYEEMNREELGIFTKALNDKAALLGIGVDDLDADMRANLITNILLGGPTGLGGVSAAKERKFLKVPARLNKYYMNSDAAMLEHITAMATAIEKRKFFGKIPERVAETRRQLYAAQAKVREWTERARLAATPQESKAAGRKVHEWEGEALLLESAIWKYSLQRDYTDNIGAMVDELIVSGSIKPKDESDVRDILSARFHERGTGGFWQLYKNLSYIDTMGSPISALTQIGDFAFAMYEGGFFGGLKHIATAAIPGMQSRITREMLGIERVAEEFADPSKVAAAVNTVFKYVGLEKMDAIGKEALLNAALEKYEARAKKDAKGLEDEIQHIFGSETQDTIADLQQGTISENVKLLVYSRLADFQPIGLSEMPQGYLTSGNGRLFYMLKTFTLKQFDFFRKEAVHKITHGTGAERVQGFKNLLRLAFFFVLANAAADELKDFILGRKTDFSDRVMDNVLRLAGSSKFVTWTARTEGIGSALSKQILPPFKFIDSVSKDVITAGDEKGLEVTASIPLIGKLAYWHMGRGTSKRTDIWDTRLKKYRATLTDVHEDLEKAKDKPAFIRENQKELAEYKRLTMFQGSINNLRKIVNQLKSRPEQTDSIKSRIKQLEERRTEMIKQFIEKKGV